MKRDVLVTSLVKQKAAQKPPLIVVLMRSGGSNILKAKWQSCPNWSASMRRMSIDWCASWPKIATPFGDSYCASIMSKSGSASIFATPIPR